MATPGEYRDVRNTIVIADDGSNTATIELRKMAPLGHYTDVYSLSHDDGFPVTVLNISSGDDVVRKHFRGPSERRAPESTRECPDNEIVRVFLLVRENNDGTERYILKKKLVNGGEEVISNDIKIMPDKKLLEKEAEEYFAKKKKEEAEEKDE